MTTSASLCEGPIFYCHVFTFMEESKFFSLFLLFFSFGKHHVVRKALGTYGQSNIFDHDLLLLTIISMINELGGETLSPYLSLCSMDVVCSKNMLWVLAIIQDYMITELWSFYLDIAENKIHWIVWRLRTQVVKFQENWLFEP